MIRRPPRSPLFPYPPLFRSRLEVDVDHAELAGSAGLTHEPALDLARLAADGLAVGDLGPADVGVHLEFPQHAVHRSEEHTSELQSPCNLVCRLLLEKKKPPL